MSDDKSTTDQMSSESVGYLGDVKKGKPRKFAMICKGAAVVSLVVYKKGSVENRKKEAKEAGKGQFYHGVVDGQGMDIRFLLARADGYEKEPVKTAVLKNFLAESADLKCKPYFEIVDAIPLLLDEEDPLVIRLRQCEAQVRVVCATQPERAAELNGLCNAVGSLLDQEQSEAASGKLDELEALLKSLGSGSTAPSGSPVSTNDSDANLDELKKLAELLKKLKPLLDQVVSAHPNRQSELVSTMAGIAGEIKSKQVDQAKQHITEFAKLLKSLAAGVSSPSPADSSNDRMPEFISRRDALEPRLLNAKQADREKATKLATVWDYANAQAEAGNFDNAFKALDRLAAAIDEVLSSASVTTKKTFSLTKLSKIRLEWDDVRNRAVADIAMLRSVVASEFEDDAEQASALAAALDALGKLISCLNEELGDRLDEVLNASLDQRESMAVAARDELQKVTSFVKTDPIMVEIDGNELVPSMQVCAPMLTKLKEIENALP